MARARDKNGGNRADDDDPQPNLLPRESKPTVPTLDELVATASKRGADDSAAQSVTRPAEDQLVARHEIYIPVHQFVKVTDDELEIINHPAFQRLGEILQLGQSHLVYRGATHRRMEHVLGTLAVAEEMVAAVVTNHQHCDTTVSEPAGTRRADPPTALERRFVRLAALLHDIGHLPAGHTLEDELGLLDKHDGVKRLNLIFDRRAWPGGEVEPLGELIDRRYGRYYDATQLSPRELLLQLIAKDPSALSAKSPIRIAVCRDIVGDTICADLLDYLHRDWHHIGKPKYFERRLFQYMEIRHDKNNETFVISLGRRPKIRTDAISAILSL